MMLIEPWLLAQQLEPSLLPLAQIVIGLVRKVPAWHSLGVYENRGPVRSTPKRLSETPSWVWDLGDRGGRCRNLKEMADGLTELLPAALGQG